VALKSKLKRLNLMQRARGLNIPFNAAALSINTELLNTLRFSWVDEPDATFYQLLESKEGTGPFAPIDTNILNGVQFKAVDHIVTRPLFDHINDKYQLLSCNTEGCIESKIIDGAESFVEAITYIKADNIDTQFDSNLFGASIELSADGKTLVIADAKPDIFFTTDTTTFEPSVSVFTNITGIWAQQTRFRAISMGTRGNISLSADGNTLAVAAVDDGNNSQSIINSSTPPSFTSTGQYGAVYLYIRNSDNWSLQAYIKGSSISNSGDRFGSSVSISSDGNTLAVGASGAETAYIFTRSNTFWNEQAIISASNPGIGDSFGGNIKLSGDGLTLAVNAPGEDSQGTGIDNNITGDTPPSQTDNSVFSSGAIYVFTRNTSVTPNNWKQQAYIKSSNTETNDFFSTLTLSNNGNILAIAATGEDSNDRSNQLDNTSTDSGAVYVFTRINNIWSQQDYIKPENIHPSARFGSSLDISDDGITLAIGSTDEKSNSIGYSGDQTNSEFNSGAAYLFVRDSNNKWNQRSYLKASNTGAFDKFGSSISISADATTLAVGATGEKSTATGINGDQLNNDSFDIGAVYIY